MTVMVNRVEGGDAEGIEQFAREFARSLCRGKLEHEDLAQDAIERWLRARPTLPPSANHRAWLTVVLKNLFVDRLRHRDARREQHADCARLPAPAREAPPWWVELGAGDVDRELAQLSTTQRTTFRLFAFEGMSYDQIAHAQGISRSTVGTRILRARSRLKELLAARNPDAVAA